MVTLPDTSIQGQMAVLFFALAIGHAFADFAWQSQFMAINKNRHMLFGTRFIWVMDCYAIRFI
jgi:hypothetical protein